MIYFVPVPIGNLDDITIRAIKILSTAESILTEDGRETAKLLALLDIKREIKPKYINIIKNNQFNYSPVKQAIVESLQSGGDVAVVSDAGTPGLSDPGFEVVRLAQEMQIDYTVLPGATALVPAIVASGLVGKDFLYLGFLPIKKGRQTLWQEISASPRPVVVYESVHRMQKLAIECTKYLGNTRKVFVARELSKSYEQLWVGTGPELEQKIQTQEIMLKGEFVVVIEGI